MRNDKHKKKPSRKVSRPRNDPTVGRDKTIDDQNVCIKAPEWAEHHRLWDEDQPCDDGRSGKVDD